MVIITSRFGSVRVKPEDVFTFPHGLIGLESCRRWVLLSDAENDAVGWLQSANLPETALAVISPRRFLPDYQVHVSRGQLAPLELNGIDQAFVLNIVAKNDGRLTVNLKAPLIINLNRRIGRQVVSSDDQSVQFELSAPSVKLRKSA
jgi:flagellar assembly factor FliW